jgi:AraC-like DNA-binding protein
MITDQTFAHLSDFRSKREAWIEAAHPLYRADIDADWGFDDAAYIRNYNLGTCILGACHAPQMSSERTLEQISRQAIDHLSFRVFLAGASDLHVEGRTVDIRAGHLQVLDMAQPMRSHSRGSKPVIHLIVPRRAFERRLGDLASFHGAMLDPAGSPVTRLMLDHMRSLASCIEAADDGQRAALTAASVSMVNAVLTPAGGDSPYTTASVQGIAIRRFIEDNLPNFDLGVDMLRARFGLSRTALYEQFEAEGGVASYIRDRRLARAMRILAGLEGEGRRRISTVGYACGFGTEKMFSRAFRRRYGVNPSEVDAGFRPQARLEYGATLMSWINSL